MADHKKNAVVLVIRGTLSLEDCVTDVNAHVMEVRGLSFTNTLAFIALFFRSLPPLLTPRRWLRLGCDGDSMDTVKDNFFHDNAMSNTHFNCTVCSHIITRQIRPQRNAACGDEN